MKIFNKVIFVVIIAIASLQAQAAPNHDLLTQATQAMPASSWIQVNQNTWQSVWTPTEYQVLGGVGGSGYGSNIGGIIRAWSGFAWNSNLGEMILYGGGHDNYAGNDVYIFQGSTLQWVRGSLPTQLQPMMQLSTGDQVYLPADVNVPASAHTYQNNGFLPTLDRFYSFGGNVFTTTSGTPYERLDFSGNIIHTGPYLFNANLANGNQTGGATGTGVVSTTPGGNMWQNLDMYTNLPGTPLPNSFQDGQTDVATIDGVDSIFVATQDPKNYGESLYKFTPNINNPSKSTWVQVGSPLTRTAWFNQGAGAYDSKDNIFLRGGIHNYNYYNNIFTNLDFLFWDLSKSGVNNAEQGIGIGSGLTDSTNGAFDFTNIINYGIAYNPIDSKFYLWGGGNAVYTLSHSGGILNSGWTLAVDGYLPINGPGVNGAANSCYVDNQTDCIGGGVLGKWHFASDLSAFVALDEVGNVWIYKPADYAAVPTCP